MNYIALDLETLKPAPADGDDDYALGITCAATVTSDGEERFWHGPERLRFGRGQCKVIDPTMSPTKCRELAKYLHAHQTDGYPVVTVNGAGFDLRVLAVECKSCVYNDALRELALDHYDMMFHFFACEGWAISLAKMAAGIGLQKAAGMDGLKATEMWQRDRASQAQVLSYCLQDAQITGKIFAAWQRNGFLRWVAKSGAHKIWRGGLRSGGYLAPLIVREAMRLPEPEPPHWVSEPWSRDKFVGWLNAILI